jgi:hypothetical protein
LTSRRLNCSLSLSLSLSDKDQKVFKFSIHPPEEKDKNNFCLVKKKKRQKVDRGCNLNSEKKEVHALLKGDKTKRKTV